MHKVLIVDDQSNIRRMINIALSDEFSLFEAEDGLTALDIIRREMPDVVLLDVMLPGDIDGLEVLEVIRQDPLLKHIRVMMVSAKGQVHDYEKGMNSGANAYFVKPFSPSRLIQAIKEQIDEANSLR
jgi:DNA-binding response OmpR family regulator